MKKNYIKSLNMQKQNHTFNILAILLISILGAVVYFNSLFNSFVWDDEALVIKNLFITDWKFLPYLFKGSQFQGTSEAGSFYKPFQGLSYLLDYSLWKLNPFGYHLTNLILHIFNSVLIYFFLKLLLNNKVALLASLLFVVHPLHTEAVSYISGRAEILASSFLILAFIYFIKNTFHYERRNLVLFCLFYILALLSKEIALILPFLILLYWICFLREKKKRISWAIAVSFFISFIYAFFRLAVIEIPPRASLALIAKATLFQRLVTIPVIIAKYILLLLFPINLHMERHFVANLSQPQTLLSIIFLGFLVWALAKSYRHSKVVFFFLSWFFIGIIPILNIIPLNATMAEHWMYLPSGGLFLVISLGIVNIYKKFPRIYRYAEIFFLALIFIFCGYLTIRRNFDWKDSLSLYRKDIKLAKDSFILHNNLGIEYFKRGKLSEAEQEIKKSIQICGDYSVAHNNLGFIYEKKGSLNKAIGEYKKSIELDNYGLAYLNLGNLYLKMSEVDKAVEVFKKALKIYPQYLDINYNLGVAYLQKGDLEKARNQWKRVLLISPNCLSAKKALSRFKGRKQTNQ